ncbi:hypothetical protein B7494_g8396 [Chlorociboria aeruginascens]|nr:hypothetical protein B7494_g8396 [Chlorociboria aeruginascens]
MDGDEHDWPSPVRKLSVKQTTRLFLESETTQEIGTHLIWRRAHLLNTPLRLERWLSSRQRIPIPLERWFRERVVSKARICQIASISSSKYNGCNAPQPSPTTLPCSESAVLAMASQISDGRSLDPDEEQSRDQEKQLHATLTRDLSLKACKVCAHGDGLKAPPLPERVSMLRSLPAIDLTKISVGRRICGTRALVQIHGPIILHPSTCPLFLKLTFALDQQRGAFGANSMTWILIASSTVGIAVTGFALGRPDSSSPDRPSSKRRKVLEFADVDNYLQSKSSPIPRPGTSSAVITPERSLGKEFVLSATPSFARPSNPKINSPNNGGGHRFSRIGDISSPLESTGEESKRDSISSRSSWLRRLSTIPTSQNNSPRSSVGPDSPSLTFSHGSAAPILPQSGSSPIQLPPNKLVKRATSGRAMSASISGSGAKSQVHSLRRPATSHQRSVTLQQQFREGPLGMKEQKHPHVNQATLNTKPRESNHPEPRKIWRPYFDSRPTKLTKDRPSGRSSDGNIQISSSTSIRVLPNESVRPTLLKPTMITKSHPLNDSYYEEDSFVLEDTIDDEDSPPIQPVLIPTENEKSLNELPKRARRSLSMHFTSPGSWISRSGSLRGSRRDVGGRTGGKRYSSAPDAVRVIASAHGTVSNRAVTGPASFQREGLSPLEDSSPTDPFAPMSYRTRSRNSSSPLPPLSRLSSFNLDLARLGLASSSSSAPRYSPTSSAPHGNPNSGPLPSTGHTSPRSSLYFSSLNSRPPRSDVADRASTLIGSDTDMKGFTLGDEDETDFQSETVFDSLRSGATGSLRSHNAPLDSMFDESPPSVNSNPKSKRLSGQDIITTGIFREGSHRIVEEDEGLSTPIKDDQDDAFETPVQDNFVLESDDIFPSSPPSFSLATKDLARLTLDDEEEDEDWTRDDENMDISHQLSPPSSSLNSRRVSPTLRVALVDVTRSGSTNGNIKGERPKSNLFDWSEPSVAEKMNYLGNSPRPKTAHVKQIADGRGSRSVGRRGPTALHIRSQSVPVVPDVAGQREHTKLTPKFGTWGLGAKGVSEDWDNDFEFDNTDTFLDNTVEKFGNPGMLVPPAIQASQANVVGHVGQIREVCLLVEDLKRLRLLAREKDLLEGPSAHLWKEAEGIIALAVPDEEDPTLSPPRSPSSIMFDESIDDKYVDGGPDAADLSRSETPFEVLNRHGRPTGFVYDGNTVQRRSVFSPDDDIFGGALVNNSVSRDTLRPPPISSRPSSIKNSSEIARSVMETMHQHRSTSDPLLSDLTSQASNKMPFDTTSLRDLVHRASVLTRTLADLIRRADHSSQSPDISPHRESSPAFTRVFTDPTASPPKHLARSQSNNSILSGSVDASPTRSIGQRMHMMTVV